MPDKYGVQQDIYCYSGTSILKNKFNIQSSEMLENAETEFTLVRAEEYKPSFTQFNLEHLKSIHFHLFQDIYDWAGELRQVDISKSESRFCTVSRIVHETINLLTKLNNENNLTELSRNDFVESSADFYCELNVIHPFRDGNGRAQRIFFEELAVNAGFEFAWSQVQRADWLNANIAGFNTNLVPLISLFNQIISPI
ncbi:MAG: cell filamentation protein Fic [Gammaproteobacteria bacterium]|nr:MAG: cell filamentation protein Fic [Gammaproteobacteria bacterium]